MSSGHPWRIGREPWHRSHDGSLGTTLHDSHHALGCHRLRLLDQLFSFSSPRKSEEKNLVEFELVRVAARRRTGSDLIDGVDTTCQIKPVTRTVARWFQTSRRGSRPTSAHNALRKWPYSGGCLRGILNETELNPGEVFPREESTSFHELLFSTG